MRINQTDLVTLLKLTSGATPIGIEATISARAKKTNNPFGEITKKIRAVGFVGANYENSVNREGTRQGVTANFKTAGLKDWQTWVVPGKVIAHKDKGTLYIRTQTTPGMRKRQFAKVLGYFAANGDKLSYDQVKDFLPSPSVSRKQVEAGLDETVDVRDYGFDGITKVKLGKKSYILG